jgi:hypothetical protein
MLMSSLNETKIGGKKADCFEIQKGASYVDVPFLAFTMRESFTENNLDITKPEMPTGFD